MAGGFPLSINGTVIASAEALYQACRFPFNEVAQRAIIREKSPMTAKMVSRRFLNETRDDWIAIRVAVMRWVLRVKLIQNWDRFSQLLHDTKENPIVEDSRSDDFWGALQKGPNELAGRNILGRLLMELRADLIGKTLVDFLPLSPPNISNFLLLGKTVCDLHSGKVSVPDLFESGSGSSTQRVYIPNAFNGDGNRVIDAINCQEQLTQDAPVNAMPPYPKRLIEVDLPIARISAHARREKSIRHGHISTLHIWWARRPLAACRAVICASLWPDPADELCPHTFREAAVQHISAFARRAAPWFVPKGQPLSLVDDVKQIEAGLSPESRARWEAIARQTLTLDAANPSDMPILRMCLLDFIADFANWDNSTVPAYLETSRALTLAAHESLGGIPGTRPLVVDPFAGGGSIPVEALRIGADAFASDLNPVPVLLNRILLEFLPKYGNAKLRMNNPMGESVDFIGLAEAVRFWGNSIQTQAASDLERYYPKDADGSTPIAYLWARTVLSEAPGTEDLPVEVPLIRSMWLCKKPKGKVALRWVRDEAGAVRAETLDMHYADGITRRVRRPILEIFEPEQDSQVEVGPVARGAATCPITHYTTPLKNVQQQLSRRNGGSSDARLYCVVTTPAGQSGRSYRLPTTSDIDATQRAKNECDRLAATGNAEFFPNESTSHYHSFVNRGPIYGMTRWSHFYAPRQLLSLATFCRLVAEIEMRSPDGIDKDLIEAVQSCLALAIGRLSDRCSSLCTWDPSPAASGILHVFARQAIPFVWDFAEGVPLESKSGGWLPSLEWIPHVLQREADALKSRNGQSQSASADHHPLPDDIASAVISDPPYYYSVQYADLSDYFFVWLRRCLRSLSTTAEAGLTPKSREIIVQSPGHASAPTGKNAVFYEKGMQKAFAEARRYVEPTGIGVFVFAHTSTAGWEAMLNGLVAAGWIVTGSWPIDTEMANRVIARGRSVLASSVHLVCRPREDLHGAVTESVGEWRDVLGELPKRIHEWMPRLAAEGVVGADAIFACLGPALEIFSRYSRVEKANGDTATLREYLEFVWAAVSTEALSLIFKDADTAGLEPDARLTAMWLWTLGGGNTAGEQGGDGAEEPDDNGDDEDTGGKVAKLSGFTLEYDAARKIAQGLGVHLEQCQTLVEVKGDKARMLPVKDRAESLFGKTSSATVTQTGERAAKKKAKQKSLFEEMVAEEPASNSATWGDLQGPTAGSTVLDRVHQSMILFAAGRGELLKRFLVEDGIGKDARFWKLAQSLSALYPKECEEKRWVDGVLARKKGLGL
jgi:putative DNA methylase